MQHSESTVTESSIHNESFHFLDQSITASCTHRPQGVIIVGIYTFSNIYYSLLLYLSRKKLYRLTRLQTTNCDIFAKLSRLDVSWLDVCKPTHLHHCFLL